MYVFPPKSSWKPDFSSFFRTNDAPLEHDQPMDEPNEPLECALTLGKQPNGKWQNKQPAVDNKKKIEKKIEKPKTKRGYGKKNERKQRKGIKDIKFCLLGTNSNGLLGKQESLKSAINSFKPSVITIQESKLTRKGLIKLKGYQLFEKLRPGGQGGGLLTAVDEDLLPVLVSTGTEEETELMTVQIKVGKYDIRIINAYGPQEAEINTKIFNFWGEVENEVIDAKDNNCMIVLQMDANAKIGKDKLKDDPNEQSNNGRIMLEMVERQGLEIANVLEQCQGLITRERISGNKTEKAVLDYIIVCERMKEFLEKMIVDEERVHVLTKYVNKKTGIKKIVSDHNVMFANFTIKFNRLPWRTRNEFFNFKNAENQKKFFEETSSSCKLSSCFSEKRSFPHNTAIFFKTLNGIFHKTFQKVRITTGGGGRIHGDETLQGLIKLKKDLEIFILNNKCKVGHLIAEKKLEETEKLLTEKISAKSADIIKEQVGKIETLDGKFSQIGFWKLKKKFCPQAPDPPMAKRNESGILVTSPNLLKTLYLQTYQHRLRQRDMKPELRDVYFLKNELWRSRLDELINEKSDPWDLGQLDKVLKSLKNNKTKDPLGMINEIFKPGIIGADLKKALIDLFNGVKENSTLPDYMLLENISSIYKSRGSRFEMENERGIFILTVLKKILDKLMYFDNIDDIDANMSDSNIGGRKERNIKNHLFMIHGIINSVINGNEDCIDIQIYDIEKAFDGLWLEDCLNDIFDTVPEANRNDKLALLYESNRKNMVAINTAVGMTERVNIANIVQQGGTWGPILCSNSIDTLGKKCRDQGIHNYRYKNISEVLIFAMCDDLNGVAKCGLDSVALNTFITTQIELKRLKFHVPNKEGKSKCHKLHVGRNHDTCSVLQVHGTEMESVSHDTYLGDILSSDGKNTRNIKKRVARGIGISTQILNLLKSICLGEFYIEIALLLREALFLSSVLTNAEIWYSLTKDEIKELDDLDKTLLRKILKVPLSTPSEAYFLELGIIPIEVYIKARRIVYLHYVLKREENEMLYTFFITQWNNEVEGDWTKEIKLNLEEFGIPCDFTYLKSMSTLSLKNMVKRKAKEVALNLLQKKQNSHSKMNQLYYSELKLQEYFKMPGIETKEMLNLFKWRVRMAPLGENFRGNKENILCPLCSNHLDNQPTFLQCEVIKKELKTNTKIEDIYVDKISLETAQIISRIEDIRKDKLKSMETE